MVVTVTVVGRTLSLMDPDTYFTLVYRVQVMYISLRFAMGLY
jgi:hypothetical protein